MTRRRVPKVDPREERAFRLRAAGISYREAAKSMDCSAATVWRLVHNGLARAPLDHVDDLRQLEAERLDLVWRAMLSKMVEERDPQAAAVCVRVSLARTALLGLAVPPPDAAAPFEVAVVDAALLPLSGLDPLSLLEAAEAAEAAALAAEEAGSVNGAPAEPPAALLPYVDSDRFRSYEPGS